MNNFLKRSSQTLILLSIVGPLSAHGGLDELLILFAYAGAVAATPIELLILRSLLKKYTVPKKGRILFSSGLSVLIGFASIYLSGVLAPGFREGLRPIILILAVFSILAIFIRFAWQESQDLSISVILGVSALTTLPIFTTIMAFVIGGITLGVCR